MKKIGYSLLTITLLLTVIAALTNLPISYAQHDDHHGGTEEMHSTVPYHPLDIEDLEHFHGHVGPFVAIGGHMGDYAVTKFDMPRYFDVTVEVECPPIPPHSCLIDGLMVSTGATYGKKNIKHIVADKIRVRISNDDTGAAAVFTIKPAMYAQLKKWVDDNVPVEERGEITFNMKPTDLFDVVYTPGKEAK